MKARAIIVEIIVFLFIVMFLYASVSKLSHYQTSYLQMLNQPFPDQLAGFMTWAVPAFEILICIGLAFTQTRKLALYTATGLMTIFTGYVVYLWFFFKGAIPCSCGGAISSLTWFQHIYFNSFFVIIGVIGILLHRKDQSSTNRSFARA
ncbi:MauE/DoxX family redox-associated membrane protein [Chitinophaga cymbidii]|uniref:MauE/DoxX family redox-associated membrane protein n=1 Tax=Chitinophaga cymbidii TaxID=1096750 RepID=UPI0011BD5091|nr:MauE/DoxX family redox-associated membrane protein [Chitinophaga cymbidii]